MVKRYYIQDYPEYSGSVLTGEKGRREHNQCECKAGNKSSFRNKILKTEKIATGIIKDSSVEKQAH